jgi:type IV fimbrial biogenesis protein FimT
MQWDGVAPPQVKCFHQKRWALVSQGFTLSQVIVVMALVGILSAIAAPSIANLGANPLKDTMTRLEGNLKLARVKAMSSTTAHRVRPISANEFIVERHRSDSGTAISTCADAALDVDTDGNAVWQKVHSFNQGEDLKFDDGVQLSAVNVNGNSLSDITDWQLCFDSRGVSRTNLVLTLRKTSTSNTQSVEVFPGGSVQLDQ